MSDFHSLVLDLSGPVAILTIDRPEKLNALDRRTIEELALALEAIRDADEVRGAIITGAGEKAFVAGADIRELADLEPLAAAELSRQGQAVFRTIEQSRKPIVAAVNGFALGGGCELALACHIRVASESARFGLPEVKLATFPGYGGTLRLPRLVGRGRALEMVLTGEMIDAAEAYRIGLVNRVVPPEAVVSEAKALVERIVRNGPLALGMAIESVNRGADVATEDAIAMDAHLFGLAAATEDMREGTTAFLEKREPRFRGR